MLLLSEDVLLAVLKHLPRGYLDQLLPSNHIVHFGVTHLSEPNSATGPLRRVRMTVTEPFWGPDLDVMLSSCLPEQRAPSLGDFNAIHVECRSSDALQHALMGSVVVVVEFFHVSDVILRELLPFAHRWQNSAVHHHPQVFHSQALFAQFFDQLVVTNMTLEIDLFNHPQYVMEAHHLWARTAVKRCRHLQILHMPSSARINGEQVIEWLKVPHESEKKKSAHIFANALATTTKAFLDAAKTDFENAVVPCSYTIKVQDSTCLPVAVTKTTLVNANTGEELRVHNDGSFFVLDRAIL